MGGIRLQGKGASCSGYRVTFIDGNGVEREIPGVFKVTIDIDCNSVPMRPNVVAIMHGWMDRIDVESLPAELRLAERESENGRT